MAKGRPFIEADPNHVGHNVHNASISCCFNS
jgi:hypothetical protein